MNNPIELAGRLRYAILPLSALIGLAGCGGSDNPARASRTRTVEVAGRVLRGRATWYGPGFAGRRTASGEVFRPHTELTAAHRTLPFGTRLRVCRGERCVVVRVNDRGPFGNAILDLSQLAAERLGIIRAGIAPVTATVLHTRVVRSAA